MATMFAPKNPDSSVCWCLSWRLGSRENREFKGTTRADAVRALCSRELAPGVLAHIDGQVAGWAGIAPRAELHPFANSRKIPHLDDLPAWSLWCLRVRPGYRKQGVTRALIDGAVAYALASGSPVVESYPVDNVGQPVDLTMAVVGTRSMFERAGFTKAADATAAGRRRPGLQGRPQASVARRNRLLRSSSAGVPAEFDRNCRPRQAAGRSLPNDRAAGTLPQ